MMKSGHNLDFVSFECVAILSFAYDTFMYAQCSSKLYESKTLIFVSESKTSNMYNVHANKSENIG